jgi:glycosyltransferase involved in cell wall biosynthesis
VLLVGDGADRTAETVALIEIAARLAQHADLDVQLLLHRAGPLIDDFRAAAPTTVARELARWSLAGLVERGLFGLRLRRLGFRLRSRRLGVGPWSPHDVVYLHTVLAVPLLALLPPARPSVACRLAERMIPLRHPLKEHDLQLLLSRVDRFLPVTGAGRDELLGEHGIAPHRVQRLPEAIVVDSSRAPVPAGEAERAALGIPPDAVVVGALGSAASDAPDLCASLSVLLRDRAAAGDVAALWVVAEYAQATWLRHDVDRAGLGDWVHVEKMTSEAPTFVEVCDILVLLTRLDDYPLTYLEAAARRIPMVCFAGNELAEIVGDDAGFVVPYLDVAAVAERVKVLIDDPAQRAARGAAAADGVFAVHSVDAVADRLHDELVALGDGP